MTNKAKISLTMRLFIHTHHLGQTSMIDRIKRSNLVVKTMVIKSLATKFTAKKNGYEKNSIGNDDLRM